MTEIIHRYRSLPCPKARLAGIAARVRAGEGVPAGQSVVVVLCSDAVIRRLNRVYRGKDRPTDVLSFHFGDPDLLGEIYISLQRADVQARRYGLTYDEELSRLLIHGLLHLAGYDHQVKADRLAMEAKEREAVKP